MVFWRSFVDGFIVGVQVLSGPSGFLGTRVLDGLVDAMSARMHAGLAPGSIVLLSSSPGSCLTCVCVCVMWRACADLMRYRHSGC